MKKFEYTLLNSYLGTDKESKLKLWMIDYMKHSFSKEEYLSTILNDMGQKEWELVSITNTDEVEQFHFKREVIDGENNQLVSDIESKLSEMRLIVGNHAQKLECIAEEEIERAREFAKKEVQRKKNESPSLDNLKLLMDKKFKIENFSNNFIIGIKQKIQETVEKDFFGQAKTNTFNVDIKLKVFIEKENIICEYYENNVLYETYNFKDKKEFKKYLNSDKL